MVATVVSPTQLSATGNASAPSQSVPVVVTTTDGETSNTFYVDVVAPPAVSISVTPSSATVRVSRTKQFTATVQNSTNTAVIWKVNGIAGGNSAVGTISASGLYKAPSAVPNPSAVTVSATAAADQSKTANAIVTITRK